MTIHYQEVSKRSKGGILLVTLFVALAVVALAYSIWRSIELHMIMLPELCIEGMILFVLLYQALGRYTFILTDTDLVIEEKNIFGRKVMQVPYAMINGVFKFRQSLLVPMKYRYKYRKLSSVDDRPVWALAYSLVEGKKLKHGRILLKGEAAFFEALEKFVPNRIRVEEDVVLFHAYIRDDAFKHGENFEDYAAAIYTAQQEQQTSKESVE